VVAVAATDGAPDGLQVAAAAIRDLAIAGLGAALPVSRRSPRPS